MPPQIEVSFKSGKEILFNPFKKNQDETILKLKAKYKTEKVVATLSEKYSDLRQAKGQEIAIANLIVNFFMFANIRDKRKFFIWGLYRFV